MRRTIRILLWAILITASIGIAGASKATAQTGSVPDSPTTQPAPSGDASEVCNSRLLKALDGLDRAEAVIATLQDQHKADQKLNAKNDDIIANRDKTIADQDKLIKQYEKRKGTTVSFLFGLIKIRSN